jgi:D-alanine-D-alanine ligase
LNIEVITTVDSPLTEAGFGSYASCLAVVESIKRSGNTAQVTVCESLADLDAVVARKPDFVLFGRKYLPCNNGDDIWFSEYFSKHQIAFFGSDREALRFDSDRVSVKIHLGNMRIKTARYFIANPKQFLSQASLPLAFPLFIKSTNDTNGNGIDGLSLVNTFAEFEAKVLSLYTLNKQPVLVEEHLAGREFTVAVICNSSGEMFASSIEMLSPAPLNGLSVLEQEIEQPRAQQKNQQRESQRAQQNIESFINIELPDDAHKVNTLAKSAFLGLGLSGFAYINVKMDKYGQCFFMGINLIPSMALETSYFLKACEMANNLSYDQVIRLMLEECVSRKKSESLLNKELKQCNLHWPRASVAKFNNGKTTG